VAPDHPQAHLAIAGDGPSLAALRARAAGHSRVHLLGSVEHGAVMRLLGATDIMCYPSRYPEGLPTVVLEAGLMGCAVIASARGGTAEVIQTDEEGLIVRTDAELESAVRRLLGDRTARVGMAERLSARVRGEFDWGSVASRFDRELRALVRRPL
jgi:glycosyltransferase involved in cell wall biosynthesis